MSEIITFPGLTTAEIKLAAAIVAALLSTRGKDEAPTQIAPQA